MPEGTPNQEPGIDFDPNKDYVAEATGEGVESQESQEIQAETEKLQEQLVESDALFAELKAVPEEALQNEGAKEKIIALYDRLETYDKKFPKIANTIGLVGILGGLAGIAAAFGMQIHEDAISAGLHHASEAAEATMITSLVTGYAAMAAAGVTRLMGKIGEWKTIRAITSV